MESSYIADKTFHKVDFENSSALQKEYERCRFDGCSFLNADLSGSMFFECEFTGCNISLARLKKTAFKDAVFTGCKMMGLQVGDCDGFNLSFSFENCILDHSSFYKLKIRNTRFKECRLTEADMTEADLSGSIFENCELAGVVFDHSNLEKADFRTAYNYSIDPESNRIKKAKFSTGGIAGLLNKYDIRIED